MKLFKKICATLILILSFQILMIGAVPADETYAQEADGLVQEGNKFFFYENGQMVRKKWKTIVTDGVKYKYYFGKNGAAYSASKLFDDVYNVKIIKIKKKKYGFDSNSHCVSAGVYVNSRYQLIAFGKGGVYSEKKTKKLRNALKTYSVTGKTSKKLYKQVIKKLGKPVSVERSDSCSPLNSKDSFTDVLLKYRYFEVQLIQNDRTKEYALDNFFQSKEIK